MSKESTLTKHNPDNHGQHECGCKVKCKNCRCRQQKDIQDILVSLEP
jgi:hypothetical protein